MMEHQHLLYIFIYRLKIVDLFNLWMIYRFTYRQRCFAIANC